MTLTDLVPNLQLFGAFWLPFHDETTWSYCLPYFMKADPLEIKNSD